MKTEPLLTIAIPTYNRSRTLQSILESLQQEAEQNFLILVADDHSSDDTEAVVTQAQKIMSNLRYHKNKKNLGYSGNVCSLYELATTEYIWFLCDDDTVIPGAVSAILRKLTKYQPTVAVFNCTWIDPYGRHITAGVTKDILYKDEREFIDYQPLMRMTYLSILVMKKITSIETIKKTNIENTIFFQLTLGLFLLTERCRFLEADVSIVHRNVGYKYGEFFKFYLIDHMKAVTAVPNAFRVEKFIAWSKRNYMSSLNLFLSQKLGLFIYHGSPTEETRDKIYTYYGKGYGNLLLAIPTVARMVPGNMLKGLFFGKLVQIHGFSKAKVIFAESINRAQSDKRKTKFTTYR